MEALARRIGFWPIQPAPLWKLADSYRAHKPLDSIGISHDAGVAFQTPGSLNPSLGPARSTTKRSLSKQPARTKRGARARGKSILIVDDVVDVTEMIGLFLKHAGFDVTTANSADRALRLTADTHFDLIISDIGMPEMNGYELAQSLRTRTDYVETPLIAVTGYTEYDDRGRS